jgi:glycosyltransferase involved in cell wall biosynthesis
MGDGPEKECLSSMVKKAGLDRDVLFTGFLENSEEWLPALDIFVLPSLTEGTPMALLEAMAMGIPVIASAVGGVPDVIEDGINGFLVPPGESRAIHERIMLLIDKPDQMKRLSRAGKETVNSRYNVRDWCRRIEQMYDSLAEGGSRGMRA